MLEELLMAEGKCLRSFAHLDSLLEPSKHHHAEAIYFPIIGVTLPIQHVLVDEKKAWQQVKFAITTYWQSVNLFTFQAISSYANNVEWVNNRLQQFFATQSSMQKLFHYLMTNQRMNYAQFLTIVLEKDIQIDEISNGLVEIILIKVGEQYIVQAIYEEYRPQYELLFAKKMYSVYMHKPIESIEQPTGSLRLFKEVLQKYYTKNRVATIIHQLVNHIDYENKKSFALKQVHLFNILTHASSGKRSLRRLHKCITQFQQRFGKGEFKITPKETVLLYYLLFYRAIRLQLREEKLHYANALTKEYRLNDYAVEIFFDIEELFHVIRPNPNALVKYYPAYYLEFIYFHIVQTFVEEGLYEDAFHVLVQEEIASCSAIYEVLNGNHSLEALAKIEATVQRDIMGIYDLPPTNMMEAIESWRADYTTRTTKSYRIASYTARHITNILKTLFVCEQLDCFEKLLEVYKKYINIPSVTAHLHQFLVQQIEEKSSHLNKESVK